MLLLYLLEMFQSQDEVCDLKHAAPFQNIIPKPFVDYKGRARYCCLTCFHRLYNSHFPDVFI